MQISAIQIRLNNWQKYQTKTKDLKRPWWFAMSNTFLEDPEMWSLTDAEKIGFIYIMSQASKQQKQEFFINLDHAERACSVQKDALLSAIKKLDYFGILTEIRPEADHDPTTIRPESDQHITLQDITLQNTTKHSIAHSDECAPQMSKKMSKPKKQGFKIDPEVAEAMYQDYPKKRGKKRGMARLKTICKSEEVQNKVWQSIWNYGKYCDETQKPFQFQKQFDSFLGEWEDWQDSDHVQELIDRENSDNKKHRR